MTTGSQQVLKRICRRGQRKPACNHPAQPAPFAAIVLKVSHVRRSRHGLCYSPKVRRDARTVWNRARPSLARALPRRHSGLARLRSPSRLRSLPAGLLANARPPLPATAAGQLPRRASRVAALRASARNVRHPAPCGVLPCAVSARPLAKSGAPRGVAAARLAKLARAASGSGCRLRLALAAARSPPAPICPPCARGGVASLPPSCHSRRIASRAPPAWKGSRCSRGVSCKGARRRALALPSLGREHAARFACPLARSN